MQNQHNRNLNFNVQDLNTILHANDEPDLTATSPLSNPSIDEMFHNVPPIVHVPAPVHVIPMPTPLVQLPLAPHIQLPPTGLNRIPVPILPRGRTGWPIPPPMPTMQVIKAQESVLRNDQVKNHLKRKLDKTSLCYPRQTDRILSNTIVPAESQNILRKRPRIEREIDTSEVTIVEPVYEQEITDIWDEDFWKTEIESFLTPMRDLFIARDKKNNEVEGGPQMRTMNLTFQKPIETGNTYVYTISNEPLLAPWLDRPVDHVETL
jgi:hypothetical protein